MKLFGRKLETRSTSYSMSDSEFLSALGIQVDGIGENKLKEITYFTCLKTLSEKMASLPCKVYQGDKAGNHYLNYLLKIKPNSYYNAATFWSAIEYNRNHYGNSFAYIEYHQKGKEAGKVKSLIVLPSNSVSIYIDDKGILGDNGLIWYVYTDSKGKSWKIKQSEMLHFKSWITADGLGLSGLSVREILGGYVDQQATGHKFIKDMMASGMISDKVLIQYTGQIDKKSEDFLVENLRSFSKKEGNKFIPLPLGMTASTLTSKLTDADFMNLTKYNAVQIAGAFGLKPNYINDFEKSSYSNSEMQNESLYKDTLLPILAQYEQELCDKLLTAKEQESGFYIKFNVDAILRGAFKNRIDTYAVAIQNGIMTINEARELEERKPLEGGDILLANGNFMPIKDAGIQWTSKGGDSENDK